MAPTSFFLALALAGGPPPEGKVTLDLGGPRQVKATIATTAAAYLVEVRMLAVHAFDAATNARLNRDRARALALQALARHLAGAGEARLYVSGAEVTAAAKDGNHYTLTLRVPRDGVTAAKAAEAAPARPAAEAVAFDSALFTRKHDYLQTLGQLAAGFRADLAAARRAADPDDPKADAPFAAAVADLDRRSGDAFTRLRSEVKGDLLLSGVLHEPEELDQAIAREQDQLRRALRAAVEDRAARRAKKEKSP